MPLGYATYPDKRCRDPEIDSKGLSNIMEWDDGSDSGFGVDTDVSTCKRKCYLKPECKGFSVIEGKCEYKSFVQMTEDKDNDSEAWDCYVKKGNS